MLDVTSSFEDLSTFVSTMFHMLDDFLFLTFTLLSFGPKSLGAQVPFSEHKFYHKAVIVDDDQLGLISQASSDLTVFWRAFNNIAIERVVGTSGHDRVEKFIKDEMDSLGWEVTEDKFQDHTPKGKLTFTNIIATHNPKAKRFLDIACHYDSKYFRDISFIGATDSAAPCAMMIQIAHNLHERLGAKINPELGLRFIFFDGEEAFEQWSPKDSIYGARHLAAKWHNEPYPEGGGNSNQLDRIDMLVLLDLLGAKNPQFYNFFSKTQPWYKLLVSAEESLARGKHLLRRKSPYFKKMSTLSGIEDDHLPFLHRDVPVLHVIPTPFPKVWHTAGDNREIIDEPTVSNLIKILNTFIAEYLHLHT